MEALGFIEAKMHTYSNKKNYKKKDENAPGDQTGEAGGGGGGEEGELDDFYVMTDAYILRLTDAHYLLAELGRHVGLSIPSLPPSSGGFNPYTSSIVSSSGTSFKY
ncbi:pub domain-containing protein, partial [Cystoisospora suis]